MLQPPPPLFATFLSDEIKSEIKEDLTALCIASEGIEEFCQVYLQYSSLTALEKVFLLAFEKDGVLSNDCVIMKIGDVLPKEDFHLDLNLDRTFGFFARKSMFDSIVLSTLNLVKLTHEPKTPNSKVHTPSSLPNFKRDYCKDASLRDIEAKIDKEIGINAIKQIKGYQDLVDYRNQRAAHYDREFSVEGILYSTIKALMKRIYQAIKVVYPRATPPLESSSPRENVEGVVSKSEIPMLPKNKNFSSMFAYTYVTGDLSIVRALKEVEIKRLIEELQLYAPDSEEYNEILEEIERVKWS